MSGVVERNVVQYYKLQGPSEGHVLAYDSSKGDDAVKQYRRIVYGPGVRVGGATTAAIGALSSEPDGRLYWANDGTNKATVGDWYISDGTSADVPGNDFSVKSLLYEFDAGTISVNNDTATAVATWAGTPTRRVGWSTVENIGAVFWNQNPIVTGTATFAANGTGIRKLGISTRAAADPIYLVSQPTTAATGATVTLHFTFPLRLSVAGSSEVSLVAYQNSGGALNVTNAMISIVPVGASVGWSGPAQT